MEVIQRKQALAGNGTAAVQMRGPSTQVPDQLGLDDSTLSMVFSGIFLSVAGPISAGSIKAE